LDYFDVILKEYTKLVIAINFQAPFSQVLLIFVSFNLKNLTFQLAFYVGSILCSGIVTDFDPQPWIFSIKPLLPEIPVHLQGYKPHLLQGWG
jgi:hypothetical protein